MRIGVQSFSLPYLLTTKVETGLERWQAEDKTRRLWRGDASVWTGGDEAEWLGWLDVVEEQLAGRGRIGDVTRDIRGAGFTHALLLGMGGSSLCADVLSRSFAPAPSHPNLVVLDSTDPASVRRVEADLDMRRTLVIASSKSGTTLETRLLLDYFLERAAQHIEDAAASQHFIAITDAGSDLDIMARNRRFRSVFTVKPEIGGRFSALSDFGMIPAAVLGIDTGLFLARAESMVRACGPDVDAASNPGVLLGTVLGVLGAQGQDKVTIVASHPIGSIGVWIEQLLAESTGKAGKGLIPVDTEKLGPPEVYGRDRIFVYLRLASRPDPHQEQGVTALEQAGYPVIRLEINEAYDLGQEFFRWEMAASVAGGHLGINPFDQPDVDASKTATRKIMSLYARGGALPSETPIVETERMKISAPRAFEKTLRPARPRVGVAECLRVFLDGLDTGDYFAILAYLDQTSEHLERLESIRHTVRDRRRVATTLGFGPRFLHSTGQVHKGGPDRGVFLQITHDAQRDLPVPGLPYTFGAVEAAQALGDLEVLVSRGRRILHVQLVGDVVRGLEALYRAMLDGLALPAERP